MPGTGRGTASGTPSSSPVTELRLRVAADPAAVPGARRFASDGIRSWGREHVLDDVALCVTELATNAALHSASTFMELRMSAHPGTVRVSVEDDGLVPAEAVEPRPRFPGPDHVVRNLEEEPTTGRGLAIVSILATDWGVDHLAAGKRVWAEFVDGVGQQPVREPVRDVASAAPGPEPAGSLPEGWRTVRLAGCPVELSLRQDQHLDELVRELQLIDVGSGTGHRSAEVAAVIDGLLRGQAHARHTGRRIAQQAAAAGQQHVDVDMVLPVAAARQVRQLNEAVLAADVLCAQQQLLTAASAPELTSIRSWMAHCVASQLEEGAEPITYATWLGSR